MCARCQGVRHPGSHWEALGATISSRTPVISAAPLRVQPVPRRFMRWQACLTARSIDLTVTSPSITIFIGTRSSRTCMAHASFLLERIVSHASSSPPRPADVTPQRLRRVSAPRGPSGIPNVTLRARRTGPGRHCRPCVTGIMLWASLGKHTAPLRVSYATFQCFRRCRSCRTLFREIW
jgi:hypothetical protein